MRVILLNAVSAKRKAQSDYVLCRHLIDRHSRIHLKSELQLAASSFKCCDVSGKFGIPTLSFEELQSQLLLGKRVESCRGSQKQ
jgi:hypothetical protein